MEDLRETLTATLRSSNYRRLRSADGLRGGSRASTATNDQFFRIRRTDTGRHLTRTTAQGWEMRQGFVLSMTRDSHRLVEWVELVGQGSVNTVLVYDFICY